jgi:hypothetical protein
MFLKLPLPLYAPLCSLLSHKTENPKDNLDYSNYVSLSLPHIKHRTQKDDNDAFVIPYHFPLTPPLHLFSPLPPQVVNIYKFYKILLECSKAPKQTLFFPLICVF